MNEATLSTTETVSLCFLLVIRPCLSPPPPPPKKKKILKNMNIGFVLIKN